MNKLFALVLVPTIFCSALTAAQNEGAPQSATQTAGTQESGSKDSASNKKPQTSFLSSFVGGVTSGILASSLPFIAFYGAKQASHLIDSAHNDSLVRGGAKMLAAFCIPPLTGAVCAGVYTTAEWFGGKDSLPLGDMAHRVQVGAFSVSAMAVGLLVVNRLDNRSGLGLPQ